MKRLKIILSKYALYQIKERKLSAAKVKQVVAYPDKSIVQKDSRILAYKLFKKSGKKLPINCRL